jgi:micrococcal nuclease
MRSGASRACAASLLLLVGAAAGCGADERCGPAEAVVQRVLDGDTVELEGGQLVRYLMLDAPEVGADEECFGAMAAQANVDLVLGRRVELRYDTECRDDYDRLLAYVTVGGREVNSVLLERGYACVLHVPPNGDARLDELNGLQARARAQQRGLWGACSLRPCR